MKKAAVLFPGQGAQYAGMGKNIYDKYDYVRDIYKNADNVLGFKISDICFSDPEALLNTTEYSQPAIFTTSMAYFEILKRSVDFEIFAMLGLSLGEYSALTASGVIALEDALKIVRLRGQLMQEAGELNPGGMVSIIGLDRETVKDICASAKGDTGVCCQIANLNCPGQIVISGDNDSLERAIVLAKNAGAKKSIKLNVSGAFHSDLMEPAREGLEYELAKYKFSNPKNKFIPNVIAELCRDPVLIKKLLVDQVCKPVLWEDSVIYAAKSGCDLFVEVGPGNVLKGLCKRIDKTLSVVNMEEDTLSNIAA